MKLVNFNEPINICIFGARGQGKSLLATHLIVDHVKKNPNVKVFHNDVLELQVHVLLPMEMHLKILFMILSQQEFLLEFLLILFYKKYSQILP